VCLQVPLVASFAPAKHCLYSFFISCLIPHASKMTQSPSRKQSFFRKLSLSSSSAPQIVGVKSATANKADPGLPAAISSDAPVYTDSLPPGAAFGAYSSVRNAPVHREVPLAQPPKSSPSQRRKSSSHSLGSPSSNGPRPRQPIYPALASPPHSPPADNKSPPWRNAAQTRFKSSVPPQRNHQSELWIVLC
jgi:hypothetical protein